MSPLSSALWTSTSGKFVARCTPSSNGLLASSERAAFGVAVGGEARRGAGAERGLAFAAIAFFAALRGLAARADFAVAFARGFAFAAAFFFGFVFARAFDAFRAF